MLDTDCELLTVETLWAIHKFSVVVLESPYTRFLSGPPNDSASFHKSGLKSEWVEGSYDLSVFTDKVSNGLNSVSNYHSKIPTKYFCR